MFTLLDEPGVADDALASRDHAKVARPPELTPRRRAVTGIDVRSLPAGSEVVVDTRNSRYRFVMLIDGGPEALVQGGRHFDRGAVVRIEGSTVGRSCLKIGWIGVGLFLELSIAGRPIVTSRVRSICVHG